VVQTALTLDLSEALLGLIGSVLDIRDVFPQVSGLVQPVLPHDRLTMAMHDDERTLVAHAFSNDDGPFLVRISSEEIGGLQDGWFKVIHDLTSAQYAPRPSSIRPTTARGSSLPDIARRSACW